MLYPLDGGLHLIFYPSDKQDDLVLYMDGSMVRPHVEMQAYTYDTGADPGFCNGGGGARCMLNHPWFNYL